MNKKLSSSSFGTDRVGSKVTATSNSSHRSDQFRLAPDPPKYLVKLSAGSAGETKQELVKVLGPSPKIRPPGGNEVPVPSFKTASIPVTNFDTPQHNYPGDRKKVDSKSEYKSDKTNYSNISTLSMAGAMTISTQKVPSKNVSIPLPRKPIDPRNFQGGPLLHNRTASGKILGSPQTLHKVDESHVPYLAPAYTTTTIEPSNNNNNNSNNQTELEALGPDNPTKVLNDTWSACWDDEVGATYYYNHQSGEATWIPPDGIS